MTPATKLLDKAGIEYRLHRYQHDPKAESYGGEAADKLGLDPARVFKTLLASTETAELLVAIVPVNGMLDLKALASAAKVKKIAQQWPTLYVSGGRRGLEIELGAEHLAAQTRGEFASISRVDK